MLVGEHEKERQMSISSKVIVAAAGATILVSIAPPVYAEDGQKLFRGEMFRQEKQERQAQSVESLCKVATERIDKVTSRYQENKDRHIANYKKMVEAYQRVITRAKSQGYDTTQLEADAKVLNEKIAVFAQAYDSWIAQLNVAKQYNCGGSEGQFKTEMAKAQTLAVKIQSAANDIRTYFQQTIRPDIKRIFLQKTKKAE